MRFKACLKMNLRRTAAPLALLTALPLLSPMPGAQPPAMQQRLSIETPSQLVVKSGSEVVQTLNVSVQPGYHVNSDKPRSEFLIPFRLTWSGTALEPLYITYPRSEVIQVGGEQSVVFSGNFPLLTHFKAAANAPKGPALMTGKLHYQACNNQMCFRPATIEVRLPVIIE